MEARKGFLVAGLAMLGAVFFAATQLPGESDLVGILIDSVVTVLLAALGGAVLGVVRMSIEW